MDLILNIKKYELKNANAFEFRRRNQSLLEQKERS
jgi:hypothetical protein